MVGGGGEDFTIDVPQKLNEKLNNTEDFYDDSLFELVDMLDEVRMSSCLYNRACKLSREKERKRAG